MVEHRRGVLHQGGELRAEIGEQQGEVVPLMVMGDGMAYGAPEPCDAIGLGIIGGRVHQPQLPLRLGEQGAHQERPTRGVRAQIVGDDDGHPAALPRTRPGGPQLGTEESGRALGADPSVKPAVAPIDQAEAIGFAVVARGLDPALAAPPFGRPQARERGMPGDLHLILYVEIGAGEEGHQLRNIGGQLIPQISVHHVGQGRRLGRCGAGQQNLHPQPFPP